jgi:beta-lactamase regulating signal transducer with metallopeptidase domain
MHDFCFLLRLTIALWGDHRLRATATRPTDSRLLELITAEARKVGLRLVPVVAHCERVAVPTVVGILRPVVLLPASIITGLTSEEFAAIIGHEFAHIRRLDLWINLLQRILESLLLFHPVVWFLSRRLSTEREICCDDLVVRAGWAPRHYAGALLRMAEICAASKPPNVTALAASGEKPSLLEHRIERLMNASRNPRLQLSHVGVLALMLTLVLPIAIPGMILDWTLADEPSEASSNQTASDLDIAPVQPLSHRKIKRLPENYTHLRYQGFGAEGPGYGPEPAIVLQPLPSGVDQVIISIPVRLERSQRLDSRLRQIGI